MGVNFLNNVASAVDTACMGFINAGVATKKGLIATSEGTSRAVYEIYSMEGFEKWSKALISNMRAISLIPSWKGSLDHCIKTMEAQKDLIYATMVVNSTAEFIKKDGQGNYKFCIPREKSNVEGEPGKIDIVKVLYGIGNPFETAYFLGKYGVVSFPLLSKYSTQIGSTHLFNLNGKDWRVGDVPLLKCFVGKPKDLCVFFASCIVTFKCLKEPEFMETSNLLKFISSVGKVILIPLGEIMYKNKQLALLAFLDVATQNAGLFAYLLKRSRDAEDRFNDPTAKKYN